MKRKYITQKGTAYIQIQENGDEYWLREGGDGQVTHLAAGIHLSRKRLQDLVKEYPKGLLNRTYCFDAETEKEFFEDARREQFVGNVDLEPMVVFFLVKKNDGKYGMGCSSEVINVEEEEEK